MSFFQKPGNNTLLKFFNYTLATIFLGLSILWLAIKLDVARQIAGDLSAYSHFDLIRSQSSLDAALVLLFFLHASTRVTRLSSTFALLFFLFTTFYFLKLTGLYAYTYDSTPWGMITYGSFLLQIPFSGERLSYLGYIVFPLLFIFFLFIHLYLNLKNKNLVVVIPVLILLSCISPIQKQVPVSIAFHPYIYSISGAFQSEENSKTKAFSEKHREVNLETAQVKALDSNVVIIILESFSYAQITQAVTPTLFALQKQSLNFTQAYSPIPHTSKALVNIHCPMGAYFSPYLWESVFTPEGKCLPHFLNNNSVFFQGITSSFENRAALVEKMGYGDFYSLEDMDKNNFQAVNYFSFEDNIVLPTSKKWLENKKNKPFLATYLTGTSHHNYQVPDVFPQKDFTDDAKLNRYLNSLHYVDSFVAKLIQQYKELGVYEDTLFVFVGDHGEGFDKSKPLMHNNNIFQSGIHIPLFFHKPESINTDNIASLVSQNEISSIIMRATQGAYIPPENESIVSACWYMDYCYSLITQFEGKLYKYILDKRNNSEMLFNLTDDYQESNNLLHSRPELSRRLRIRINQEISHNLHSNRQYLLSQDSNYLEKKSRTFSRFKAVEY